MLNIIVFGGGQNVNYFEKIRNKSGLTIKQASEKLGISYTHLWYIEQNERAPGRELIKKLSIVYSTPIEDIFLNINLTNR